MQFDLSKIELYVKEGETLVRLGYAAYEKIRELFTAGNPDDDKALAELDAQYAARIDRAKADAGQ